jgi:hypothetical protein
LNLFQVSGEPFEFGYRLGEIVRPVFTGYMEQGSARCGDPFVQQLCDAAHAHFLGLLDGMAAGLGSSADDVFLWNCRGELTYNAPDGCTMVDVQPVGKPGGGSFY